MDLDSEGGYVFLFEFTSQMAFYECGFAGTSISDKDQFEGGHILF
jgi:hypothetical protein